MFTLSVGIYIKIKIVAVYAVESPLIMSSECVRLSCQKAITKAPWGVGVGSFKPFTTHSQEARCQGERGINSNYFVMLDIFIHT